MAQQNGSKRRGYITRIDGDKLVIEVDLLQDGEPSGTGKSTIIATSGGFDNLNEGGLYMTLTVGQSHKKKTAQS